MNLVITGSSTGIGRSIAEHLLAQGHRVWGIARSDQSALAARFPDTFRFTRGDVSCWDAMRRLPAEIGAQWRSLDALVACAGIQGEIGPAMQVDPLKWSATVRSNLDGTFFPLRALYPLLLPAVRRAKIVGFSGGGATKARNNFSAYGAAKTAVVRLFENIAAELHELPVDINTVAPGAINTRLTDEVISLGPAVVGDAEYQAALKQKVSGGASLAKVLELVDWLLSSASDGVSGRLLAAPWDPWSGLPARSTELAQSDIYTLRRITPEDRGLSW